MSHSEGRWIPDRAAMLDYGRAFAAELGVGDVVLLHGDLGAGKTALVQGIAAGLGIVEPVQSPTFGLVAEHRLRLDSGREMFVYHLDLYRLDDPDELDGIGYDRFVSPDDGISLIEWPERAGDWLPESFWLVRIGHGEQGGRMVERTWHAERG